MKPLVYVAGKFRDETKSQEKANARSAEMAARTLWDIGYRAIVPHTMFGIHSAEPKDGIKNEDIMSACLKVLGVCDCIFMMKNYKRSSGALRERQFAQNLGIPILYDYNDAEIFINQWDNEKRI